MLPDFPKIKAKLANAMTRLVRERAQADPFLQIPRTVIHFEGNAFSNRDVDGRLHESSYTSIEATSTVLKADVIANGIEAYVKAALEAAAKMNEQAAKMAIGVMTKALEAAGQVVDNEGKPFGFDSLLKAMEKIQIDFDEDGKADMPSVVVHPEQWEKMKTDPQWNNPENQKRMDELIERKRKDWNDREGHRKLVD